MALLLLNDFTSIKEMYNAIYKETKLESNFIFQGIEYTASDNDFYKIRVRHKNKTIRKLAAVSSDFYRSNELTSIEDIQNYVFEKFGFEIILSKKGEFLKKNEKINAYIFDQKKVDFGKIDALNLKLQTVLNDIFLEMQESNLYFEYRKMKSSTIKDIEIDVEMNFILSKDDPLFNENSNNFVCTLEPFVNSNDLNQFQEWYLNWDYSLYYHELSPPPCVKPNRILYELHQKMELIDLHRIENIWVDVKYRTQRF